MSQAFTPALLERAAAIRIAVFDVDGVMTDGRLHYAEDGTEFKSFHSRDGLGLKALLAHDIDVAIITARQSRLVARRMAELGIPHVLQGRENKAEALAELLAERGLEADQAAYAGDDLVDWPAMGQCLLKCAPADASHWIRARANFIAEHAGGRGAARDICELILAGHGKLDTWQESFR